MRKFFLLYMNYRIVVKCAVTAIFLTILLTMIMVPSGQLLATDLLISRILLPGDSVLKGDPIIFKFEIKNQNVKSATNYLTRIRFSDGNGNQVYSFDTTGAPIEPFTTQEMTINSNFKAIAAGLYNLKIVVDYSEEINRSNDTARKAVMVYDNSDSVDYKLLLNINFYKNSFFPKYGYGDLTITYPPYSNWKYINSYFTLDTTDDSDADWTVQNGLLPSKGDSNSFQISVNLDWLDKGYKISDKIYNYTIVSDTPVVTKPDEYDWSAITVKLDTLSISYGVIDTTKATTTAFTYTPPVQTTAPVIDSVYRGCNVPNMDLDSSANNPVSVPGYAGDKNACAPTGAANSMQWLENTNPNINSGLTHREKLIELSKLMKRPDNEGAFIRDFIEAKLEFINNHKLPIRVKFQVRGQDSDIESPGKIENDAINRGDGGYPKWDFLKKEMKDEEDVEMFMEFHEKIDDDDNVTGRHVVTASGVAFGAGNKIFWYKDDGDQENPGGTRERMANWDTLSNGAAIRNSPFVSGDTTWYTSIYGVVSESYDSTVVFKEKGTLQKIWEGFKGFGRWLVNDEVIESRSGAPEYMNIMARKNPVSTPEWIVRNYPLLPAGSDSLRNVFFDLSMPGINPANQLDSLQAHIFYSSDVIDSAPTVNPKEWYNYRAVNSNNISNESSVDPAAVTFPADFTSNVFPDYDANEPWIKDSLFVKIINHAIDLDSAKYNSSTVTGYLGDEGAGAISAFASVIDFLETNYQQINTGKNLREKLYQISSLIKRTENLGIERSLLLKAILNFIDDRKIPVGINFQSIRYKSGDISSDGGFGHFAKNRTPGSGAVERAWLISEIKSGRIAAIELGWYDNSGRKYGKWAIVSGIMYQKGVLKLRLLVDEKTAGSGGLVSAFVTIGKTGGVFDYVVEFSEPAVKCLVESYVSVGYDPSVIFTSVDDNLLYRDDLLSVKPTPAANGALITIEAGIPADGYADLSVYDLLGNKIAGIFSGELTKGMSSFKFQTGGMLPAGVYLITLNGEGFISRNKMIIR